MRLIYIHGINNQGQSASLIENRWSSALRNAIGASVDDWWGNVEIRTAYYGDALAEAEESWDGNSEAVSPMGPGSPSTDFAPDELATFYMEIQKRLGISDEQVIAELGETEDRETVTTMAGGAHKKWLKAIARVIEKTIPASGPLLAKVFLKQAGAYLHKPGLFDEINQMVKAQVFDAFTDLSRTVIISHSLGTIVSYVLLREMSDSERLPLFVTLGSPLGIGTVKKRIQPPFITPPIAMHWINGSDPEDFVALYPELSNESFGPAVILNESDLENGYEDAHSITKYLSHSKIADPIVQVLRS